MRIKYGKSIKGISSKIFNQDDIITINPKIIHRMEAINNSIYLEASTPELNDVVRLNDDYKKIELKKSKSFFSITLSNLF